METNGLSINQLQLKRAAFVIRAVNHPLRQQMLTLMHERGKVSVTKIYQILELDQSVASLHLRILRESGLVATQTQGKRIFYSVNSCRVEGLHKTMSDLLLKE